MSLLLEISIFFCLFNAGPISAAHQKLAPIRPGLKSADKGNV